MPQSNQSTRASRVASITNQCQGGGNKKAGLAPSVGLPSSVSGLKHVLARVEGTPGYFPISYTNQIGGIGRTQSMTQPLADGVNKSAVRLRAQECKRTVPLNYPQRLVFIH